MADSGYAHNHITETVTKYTKCRENPRHEILRTASVDCNVRNCSRPARQQTGSATNRRDDCPSCPASCKYLSGTMKGSLLLMGDLSEAQA